MIKIYPYLLLKNGLKFMINQEEIRIKTSMQRPELCDFSDAYIVVKGIITVTESENAKGNKSVAFKYNASFINCISKTNGIQIAIAEDLVVVMPTYNLLEYSRNYRKTGSLWNYYRDEPGNPLSFNSESFKYKTSITGILIMFLMVKLVMMQTKLAEMKLKLMYH